MDILVSESDMQHIQPLHNSTKRDLWQACTSRKTMEQILFTSLEKQKKIAIQLRQLHIVKDAPYQSLIGTELEDG